MNPTKEQWFWEQCGFKDISYCSLGAVGQKWSGRRESIWGKPYDWQYLDIDLNNLFEYAVPKLSSYQRTEVLLPWAYEVIDIVVDPALALFWAIYKAFGGKE